MLCYKMSEQMCTVFIRYLLYYCYVGKLFHLLNVGGCLVSVTWERREIAKKENQMVCNIWSGISFLKYCLLA